ncbi:FecR family protein [Chitinophaga sp. sic0106]|uniref:FecR family protein n=1 Tax=Chitinophaga sp. sic0106 TaxID=2854785 RepID=UPI001C46A295|nr:FecR domain-containing protein [Chitinophaga sp. sic0106]MBV7533447.1 FecR domain-containing protein [Chitinophaga sp. sic0106]
MKFPFFRNKVHQQTEQDATRGIAEAIDHLREAPSAWNEDSMGNEHATGERVLGRLMGSIATMQQQRRKKVRRIATIAAAAAVALAVVVVTLNRSAPPKYAIAQAMAGQQQKVVLPDGSTVQLNAGSRLRYPEQFDGQAREVTLVEGEAFFDIKQDSKRPFIVKADSLETTVLGTSFNIRAYRFINSVTVTVASGKVSVNGPAAAQPFIVTPDQQVTYARGNGKMELKATTAAETLGWMEGKLLFSNQNLRQVAGLIENKFNVKVILDDDKLSDYHFTASFDGNESLTDVLDALTLTKGLQYTVKDSVIHILHAK